MSKTREALFSMLEARGVNWAETMALDLFAGSGSLGLECVSRGAPLACFVDKSREACACISANIAALEMEGHCKLFNMDVSRFLRNRRSETFKLAFIDPPYRQALASTTLSLLSQSQWLERDAFVVAEVERTLKPVAPIGLELCVERNFGQTTLFIWKAL